MKKFNWDVKKLLELVPKCINFTEVLEGMNIPRKGNNTQTLRRILDNNNTKLVKEYLQTF